MDTAAELIMSRAEAKSRGLNKYFTGKPCKHGHVGPRWVKSPNCVTCKAADNKTERFIENQKQYRSQDANKRRKRELLLWNNYRITLDEYAEFLKKQDYRCAICKTKLDAGRSPQSATVDHCHSTGKVRGILCNLCNRGLGLFRDNKEILRAAAKYLGLP